MEKECLFRILSLVVQQSVNVGIFVMDIHH